MPPAEQLVDVSSPLHELVLVCFPPAGGAASFYNGWRRQTTGGRVLIAAVQPPGRETRIGERPVGALEDLAVEQAEVIARNYADRHRIALLGHSMGALAAWRTAALLEAQGCSIDRLIVSAGLPPGVGVAQRISSLDDEAFVQRIAGLGGIPEPFLSDRALLANLYLPTLRHDYRLVESFLDGHEGRAARPLAVPVSALAGRHDRRATPEAMERWRPLTDHSFELGCFDGGHFFIRTSSGEVLRWLLARLGPARGAPQ